MKCQKLLNSGRPYLGELQNCLILEAAKKRFSSVYNSEVKARQDEFGHSGCTLCQIKAQNTQKNGCFSNCHNAPPPPPTHKREERG